MSIFFPNTRELRAQAPCVLGCPGSTHFFFSVFKSRNGPRHPSSRSLAGDCDRSTDKHDLSHVNPEGIIQGGLGRCCKGGNRARFQRLHGNITNRPSSPAQMISKVDFKNHI